VSYSAVEMAQRITAALRAEWVADASGDFAALANTPQFDAPRVQDYPEGSESAWPRLDYVAVAIPELVGGESLINSTGGWQRVSATLAVVALVDTGLQDADDTDAGDPSAAVVASIQPLLRVLEFKASHFLERTAMTDDQVEGYRFDRYELEVDAEGERIQAAAVLEWEIGLLIPAIDVGDVNANPLDGADVDWLIHDDTGTLEPDDPHAEDTIDV